MVHEMARFVYENVGILSDVFIVIWGIQFGGVCVDGKCKRWILVYFGSGSANFPTFLLLEINANVRNISGYNQCQDACIGGEAFGYQPGVSRFA